MAQGRKEQACDETQNLTPGECDRGGTQPQSLNSKYTCSNADPAKAADNLPSTLRNAGAQYIFDESRSMTFQAIRNRGVLNPNGGD